jgi:hypothetical protein
MDHFGQFLVAIWRAFVWSLVLTVGLLIYFFVGLFVTLVMLVCHFWLAALVTFGVTLLPWIGLGVGNVGITAYEAYDDWRWQRLRRKAKS